MCGGRAGDLPHFTGEETFPHLTVVQFWDVLGHGFCVLGSRIVREVWVSDFAWSGTGKSRVGARLFIMR